MKWPRICLLILVSFGVILLVACSPGGVASRRSNCSNGGEVCVSLSTVKSFAIGASIPLEITVTSSKDFTDLHLTLHTGAEITMDGPKTWENDLSNPSIAPGYAYWNFAIKAGQTLTFNRVLHFPQKEGYFNIDASVANVGRIIDAEDYFDVLLTQEKGGQVIFAGTPLPPHTPFDASGVYAPGTPVPTLATEPIYTSEVMPNPTINTTSTPIGEPYPMPTTRSFPIAPTSPPYP